MIPVAKPYFTKDDETAVAAAVGSGWVLQGPKVDEFEKKIAEYIGIPYALATSSCTTALHMALIVLGLIPGDEVIVPSLSFIATANCVVHAGLTPVFADIHEQTYNIDPNDIEKRITKKTKAIIAVHQIGLPADMTRIMTIAKKHNLAVIEDAACALGSYIDDKHVGLFGDMAAFSFHPRKAITTAEGGLFVTKKAHWAKQVSLLRSHGADMSVAARHTSKKILIEHYPVVGYNYRMSDIHAALGLSQFKNIEYILDRRTEIATAYDNAFGGHPVIVGPFVPPGYVHSYQSYMIRLKNGAQIRDTIMQKLLNKGIATRGGVMASHLEPPYRGLYPTLSLPVTEKIAAETIILPLFPQMTKSEQELVIQTLISLV